MMVEDIYGKNTSKLGLPADIIASSLGKIGKMSPEELSSQKDEDIARSLITSFAINIANLTAISLKQTNVDSAIILADFFHHHRFYCLVQVLFIIFSQFWLSSPQESRLSSLSIRLSSVAWAVRSKDDHSLKINAFIILVWEYSFAPSLHKLGRPGVSSIQLSILVIRRKPCRSLVC